MSTLLDMLNKLAAGDAEGAQTAFNSVMAEKTAMAVEVMKQDVARNMFDEQTDIDEGYKKIAKYPVDGQKYHHVTVHFSEEHGRFDVKDHTGKYMHSTNNEGDAKRYAQDLADRINNKNEEVEQIDEGGIGGLVPLSKSQEVLAKLKKQMGVKNVKSTYTSVGKDGKVTKTVTKEDVEQMDEGDREDYKAIHDLKPYSKRGEGLAGNAVRELRAKIKARQVAVNGGVETQKPVVEAVTSPLLKQTTDLLNNTVKNHLKTVVAQRQKTQVAVLKKKAVAPLPKNEEVELEESTASHELVLHANNDADLHRQSHTPIIANLKRKVAKGTYDHEKAKKLWGYHADRAAQSYAKQHGDKNTPWHKMFTTADRREAAAKFADHAREELGVNESVKLQDPPFDPDPPKKEVATPGKFGKGYSVARKLARDALEKQIKQQAK